MYGLTDQELQTILQILHKFPQIKEAVIFGSRAMGRERRGSDVDIALKAVADVVSDVSYLLNQETLLPYYFDVVDYQTITVEALKAHIDRVGKVIYSADCC